MKITANYALKKPEGTDVVNIEDFNENADKIDLEIKSLNDNKQDKVEGKGLSTNDYTTAEKNKLAGIATGANNYTHPSSHPASMITQDANNRFVSDTEKANWNAKETTSGAQTKANTAESNAKSYADTKIAGVNIELAQMATKQGDLAALKTTAKSNLVGAVNELFQSVSDGKNSVATAIADKGVPTVATDSFDVMANNIKNIKLGYGVGDSISYTQLGFSKPLVIPLAHSDKNDYIGVGSDGCIYVASKSTDYLRKFDSDGNLIKSVYNNTIYHADFADDYCYIMTSGYTLKKFDSNLSLIWTMSLSGSLSAIGGIYADESGIYISCTDSDAAKVSVNGTELWTHMDSATSNGGQITRYGDYVIYVTKGSTNYAYIDLLDAYTGKTIVSRSSREYAPATGIAMDSTYIYHEYNVYDYTLTKIKDISSTVSGYLTIDRNSNKLYFYTTQLVGCYDLTLNKVSWTIGGISPSGTRSMSTKMPIALSSDTGTIYRLIENFIIK